MKDKLTPDSEYDRIIKHVADIYGEHAGIELDIETEERVWSGLLYEHYNQEHKGIRKDTIAHFSVDVENRFGKRFDNIVYLVHTDNWLPKETRLWGWNISAGVRGYQVQQCRYDGISNTKERRITNTAATLYHEIMHSHDVFIYRMNGYSVENSFKNEDVRWVRDWDDDVVHGGRSYGGHPYWDYIGSETGRENTEALERIQYQLRGACAKRKRQFNDHTPLLEQMQEGWRNAKVQLTQPYAIPCFDYQIIGNK